MKKNRASDSSKGSALGMARALGIGMGSGVIVWTALLFVAAWLLVRMAEPERFIIPAVFVLAAVSSFTSSCIASKLCGARSFVPGLVTGGALLFAVWAISLACAGSEGEISVVFKLLLCADFIIFSLLGGKLTQPSGKRPKKKRKMRK